MDNYKLNAKEKEVVDILKEIKDPETDMDIVSLGLVYGFTIEGDSIDVWMDFQGNTPQCFFCKTLAWSIIEKISTEVINKLKSKFKSVRVVEATNPKIVYKSST
ncbi:MAG: hypothetical protein DRI28_06300 [Caldiserica bacterium]|nr:MAG: hypothetical protein DRI28_06300 [Caldisericota bacterium]